MVFHIPKTWNTSSYINLIFLKSGNAILYGDGNREIGYHPSTID